MTLTLESLEGLRAKYARMLAMRAAHVDGTEDLSAVATQMADLASRFPGALREMDDLPLLALEARARAVEAALRGHEPPAPWMEATARFHALMRGALSVKRWLAGRKALTAAVREQFAREAPGLPWPEDAGAWSDDLDRIAKPPRGRLAAVVFVRLSFELGVPTPEAQHLVFGRSRRPRVG